jgi:prepilin-type N-terminal cleavage/methylation domain-containing protein
MPASPDVRAAVRGLTLLELMMALAVLAILAALTVPSFAAALDRGRLKQSAETLLADLGQARLNAAERGQVQHWSATPAAAGRWCYAIAREAGCGCGDEHTPVRSSCQVHRAGGAQVKAVALVEARPAALHPDGRGDPGGATFATARGESLRVDLLANGRSRICSPGGTMKDYAAC